MLLKKLQHQLSRTLSLVQAITGISGVVFQFDSKLFSQPTNQFSQWVTVVQSRWGRLPTTDPSARHSLSSPTAFHLHRSPYSTEVILQILLLGEELKLSFSIIWILL